jgi:hypothetical protein
MNPLNPKVKTRLHIEDLSEVYRAGESFSSVTLLVDSLTIKLVFNIYLQSRGGNKSSLFLN